MIKNEECPSREHGLPVPESKHPDNNPEADEMRRLQHRQQSRALQRTETSHRRSRLSRYEGLLHEACLQACQVAKWAVRYRRSHSNHAPPLSRRSKYRIQVRCRLVDDTIFHAKAPRITRMNFTPADYICR